MKEGYLQNKIRELNKKVIELEDKIGKIETTKTDLVSYKNKIIDTIAARQIAFIKEFKTRIASELLNEAYGDRWKKISIELTGIQNKRTIEQAKQIQKSIIKFKNEVKINQGMFNTLTSLLLNKTIFSRKELEIMGKMVQKEMKSRSNLDIELGGLDMYTKKMDYSKEVRL